MSGQIRKTSRVKRDFYRLMLQKDSGEFKFSSTVIPLSLRKGKREKKKGGGGGGRRNKERKEGEEKEKEEEAQS